MPSRTCYPHSKNDLSPSHGRKKRVADLPRSGKGEGRFLDACKKRSKIAPRRASRFEEEKRGIREKGETEYRYYQAALQCLAPKG